MGLFEAWMSSPFFRDGVVLWRLIPFANLWSIWGERNDRDITGSSKPMDVVMLSALRKIEKLVERGLIS